MIIIIIIRNSSFGLTTQRHKRYNYNTHSPNSIQASDWHYSMVGTLSL